MRHFLFWVLFPFVIPQAIQVRRTAPRFAGASGPTSGSFGAGRRHKLAAIGDSIIAGVGASEHSKALVGRTSAALAGALGAEVHWSVDGQIGATSTSALRSFAEEALPSDADFVVVSLGVNDVTSLARLSRWKRNLSSLLERISARAPEAIVAVVGLPPLGGFPLLPQPLRALIGLRGKVFDDAARHVTARFPNALHIPVDFETHPDKFAPDGFHPSEASYEDFGRAVADGILRHLRG